MKKKGFILIRRPWQNGLFKVLLQHSNCLTKRSLQMCGQTKVVETTSKRQS